MRPRATCLACGLEGDAPRWDPMELDPRTDQPRGHDLEASVTMTIVELKGADIIPTTVALKVAERKYAGERITSFEMAYISVPGRYGAETRCVDVEACKARVAALDAHPLIVGTGVAPDPPLATELRPIVTDGPTWFDAPETDGRLSS